MFNMPKRFENCFLIAVFFIENSFMVAYAVKVLFSIYVIVVDCIEN